MGVTFAGATTSASVGGTPIPDEPDLARLRVERSARLRDAMRGAGVDVLVVLGTSGVHYATGARMPSVDPARATLLRPVAVVLADDPLPHLFTPYPDGACGRLADDHVHPPLFVDLEDIPADAVRTLTELVAPGASVAADETTPALVAALGHRPIGNGAAVLGAARIAKTPDELACLRRAQWINEQAMAHVQPLARPGTRQTELTGALLRRAFELGATGVGIDSIWQVVPESKAAGPWTFHGDVAYPTPTTDRLLRHGDVLWVDSGILYEGYPSDFGRTWIVGADPTPRQQAQFERWWAVMQATLDAVAPGATGGDLCRAARAADPISASEGRRPWLDHFYLVHGLGVDSAEMPLLGTDLGEAFDDSVVLEPGMVLVLEPVIWDDGAGGHRAEDIVVVTDDGWAPLSDHPYAPFRTPDGGA
ncbi:MAG TPA: Xaa-Pro peptidase family protein [Acidimicrobiales bacterium]|nr:Xaa-Pro peptidase family protein [Acidimicrobiales bacterium]